MLNSASSHNKRYNNQLRPVFANFRKNAFETFITFSANLACSSLEAKVIAKHCVKIFEELRKVYIRISLAILNILKNPVLH